MNSYFINEVIDNLFINFLDNNKDNSFENDMLKILCLIYGDLDIINPYKFKDESQLYKNMMKYGNKLDNIKTFFSNLENFIKTKNNKKGNNYYTLIQKEIIDMYYQKNGSIKINDKEINEFFKLLWTTKNSDYYKQSLNYLYSLNPNEIEKYFKEKFVKKNVVKEEKKDLLSLDAYKILNYDIENIRKMSNNKIQEINKEVYKSFDIDSNTLNKEYLLSEKIKSYKSFSNPVTTGNGYVDILLIMGVIVTTIMTVIIFGTIIF